MTRIIEIESSGISSINLSSVKLSYQIFGKPLGETPVVLINHALTGNSSVSGEKGWWNDIVGEKKVIDTRNYTVLAFDLNGNQYNPEDTSLNGDQVFDLHQIATLQLKALSLLRINRLYAIVGGSLGGGLAWEIWVQSPNISEHIVSIASHWQSSSWVQASCQIQKEAIQISSSNFDLVRKFSMFLYRNPINFASKFQDDYDAVEAGKKAVSWLNYHGEALSKRMTSSAYLNVLHFLSSINAKRDPKAFELALKSTNTKFCLVGFNSDILFPIADIHKCKDVLTNSGVEVRTHEIDSDFGHDAFLIEHEKLSKVIQPIFNKK